MDEERLRYLLQQYAENRATREEVAELFDRMKKGGGEDMLRDLILEAGRDGQGISPLMQGDWDKIWSVVRSARVLPETEYEAGSRRKARKISFPVWARVAAVLFLLCLSGIGYWIFSSRRSGTATPVAAKSGYQNDIGPGRNKAVLTLADGTAIDLDSTQKGALAQQGSTSILKLNSGALAYNVQGRHSDEVLFNTISTPHGGQYEIILPDGSKVWLNAASSLRFPTAFNGNERLVELKGEAYFEVAHVAQKGGHGSMPFRVRIPARGMDVDVLGTQFDVMAYDNERAVNTTLLEGAVKVISTAHEVKLVPGRQAVMDNQTHALSVKEANTDQVVAWKNGFFRFRETNIRELMRQVERWYDVEVVYNTNREDQDYTGVVPRNQNVSALLHTLELTGTVHFRIEGKKIIVLP